MKMKFFVVINLWMYMINMNLLVTSRQENRNLLVDINKYELKKFFNLYVIWL